MIFFILMIVFVLAMVIAIQFSFIDESKDKHATRVNGKRVIHADTVLERIWYQIGYAYHDYAMDKMNHELKRAKKHGQVFHHGNVEESSLEEEFHKISGNHIDYSDPKNNPFER